MLGKRDVVRRTDLPDGTSATEFRVVTPALARNIVMESDVIGIATPRQLESDVASGRLVILPIAVPELKSCYGIISLARRTPSPAATAFLQILREVEREIETESSR